MRPRVEEAQEDVPPARAAVRHAGVANAAEQAQRLRLPSTAVHQRLRVVRLILPISQRLLAERALSVLLAPEFHARRVCAGLALGGGALSEQSSQLLRVAFP